MPREDARTLLALWKKEHPETEPMDDDTWDDLELDHLTARLDVCETQLGSMYLYTALHMPVSSLQREKRAQLQKLLQDDALRTRVMAQLADTGSLQGLCLLAENRFAQLRRPKLCSACCILWFLCLPLLFCGPWALCFLAVCVCNTALFYLEKDAVLSYSCALRCAGRLVHTAKKLSAQLSDTAPALCRALADAAATLRCVLPYAAVRPDSVIGELAGALTLIPVLHYRRTAETLTRRHGDIIQLITLLGEIEFANAALSFAQSVPFCCTPEFSGECRVQCEDLYHPLLDDPVPNSADLSASALFTGANASGKSTFLKAVGINVLLAQTAGICTAHRFCTGRMKILCALSPRGSITSGESCFTAELHRIQYMYHAARTEACLCLTDELFSGTNTVERIAAAAAVLRLLSSENCLCLAATHDTELTQLLCDTFLSFHFSQQLDGGRICFDYRLCPGACRTRNALALLRQLDFPPQVAEYAEKTAASLEKTL